MKGDQVNTTPLYGKFTNQNMYSISFGYRSEWEIFGVGERVQEEEGRYL